MMRTMRIKIGPVTLTRWTGPAFRADSGYSSRLSAAEEAEEFLRQQDHPEPWHQTMRDLIPYMRSIPQRDIFWVTRRKKAAQPYADRYGTPIERVELPSAAIIGADGEGGYLVIRDVRRIRR